MAAAVVFFCLMSVCLVYSVRGGTLIQALCASAPLFYYFFVLFMLYTDIIHLFCHVHPVNKHCDDDVMIMRPSDDPERMMSRAWRLFVTFVSLFRYIPLLSTIISLFGAGATPFFTAPARAPRKPFRRLRLWLRPKCVGSGGSGSGSASQVLTIHDFGLHCWICFIQI